MTATAHRDMGLTSYPKKAASVIPCAASTKGLRHTSRTIIPESLNWVNRSTRNSAEKMIKTMRVSVIGVSLRGDDRS